MKKSLSTKKTNITPIGDLVQTVLSRIKEEKKDVGREDIYGVWSQAVGDVGYKHGKPTALRRKVLRVCVDNSGWLQEFSLRKRKLLKKLQMHFGKDRITDIHFRIGEPEV